MIIRSLNGDILYQSIKRTFKETLEQAVCDRVDLSGGNFRRCRLGGARLDGLVAPGACFWGADLYNADMSGVDLRGSDLRNADLKDTCLAESNLKNVDFSGSYFNNTILRQCNMAGVILSCPSIFDCDLAEVESFDGAVYRHKGEMDIPFQKTPIVINGLSRKLIVLGKIILWGEQALLPQELPPRFIQDYRRVRTTIDTLAAGL